MLVSLIAIVAIVIIKCLRRANDVLGHYSSCLKIYISKLNCVSFQLSDLLDKIYNI
jgi:uncharacterized protein YoxC